MGQVVLVLVRPGAASILLRARLVLIHDNILYNVCVFDKKKCLCVWKYLLTGRLHHLPTVILMKQRPMKQQESSTTSMVNLLHYVEKNIKIWIKNISYYKAALLLRMI